MQLFSCDQCHAPISFEQVVCPGCGKPLAFLPARRSMITLEPLPAADDHGSLYSSLSAPDECYRLCRNGEQYGACNWAVAHEDTHALCHACRLNDVIPNIDEPKQRDAWLQLEAAKRRLVYSLFMLDLPVESRSERPKDGLSFRFLSGEREAQVFTGHNDGVITINVAEADDPFREKMRAQLGEAYRTLLGHFRHEIGHYYWDRLIKATPLLAPFRALFGDERRSYGKELERHYRDGPPKDWAARYVSAYASMHPWEDWAETWAHYMHIFDTLETAKAFGLRVEFAGGPGRSDSLVDAKTVRVDDFAAMASDWGPLTMALNSLNRSMGLRDVYPFVLTDVALEKLRFVHEVISAPRAPAADESEPASAQETTHVDTPLRELEHAEPTPVRLGALLAS